MTRDEDELSPDAAVEPAAEGRFRFRRPGRAAVFVGLALLCTAALLAASGYLTWQHRQSVARQHQSAEYAAAARRIVYTLMAVDTAKAKDNVAQILDNTTGQFHDEFQGAADDFIKLAQDGKVVTNVNVKSSAVESMTKHSATVLVTASSTVSNAAGGEKQPRTWRLGVDVVRADDRIKMSKLEFVP